MKTTKKLLAVLLAFVMVMTLGVSAFAQTVGTAAAGTGSITITNPARGETYGVLKIFNATYSATDPTAVVYTGTIPSALTNVFETNAAGNIVVKSGVSNDAVLAAVQSYADGQTATASAVANGDPNLVFAGLPYGYYAVKSTQGPVVTITSVKPSVTVNDKNTKDITADKTVEAASYSIGDTVRYTAAFDTVAFVDGKQVIKYTISDTLPEFLDDVAIDSVTIYLDGDTTNTVSANVVTMASPAFTNKSLDIPWATAQGTTPETYVTNYPNGAKIVVNYHGTLTSVTNINAGDTNTVSIQPTVWNGTTEEKLPTEDTWKDSATITTYAAALKKVDENNAPLAGAAFTVPGLVVTQVEPGVYKVDSYDSTGATAGTAMSTDSYGKLYILGLASNVSLNATETTTPAGYNKATGTLTIPVQVLSTTIYEASGTNYYDADGNLVSSSVTGGTTETVTKNLSDLDAAAVQVTNQKGSELPSTGGIGTIIFYVLGGILIVGAAIILVAKKRAKAN